MFVGEVAFALPAAAVAMAFASPGVSKLLPRLCRCFDGMFAGGAFGLEAPPPMPRKARKDFVVLVVAQLEPPIGAAVRATGLFYNFQQNIVWRRVGTFKFGPPAPCLVHPHPLMRSFLKLIPSCSPSACLLALAEPPEPAEAS